MSDSTSLDAAQQLRAAATYGSSRPARVLGKTDIAWLLDAPQEPVAPDAAELARREALDREAAAAVAREETERARALAVAPAGDEQNAWDEILKAQSERPRDENVIVHERSVEARARAAMREIAGSVVDEPPVPLGEHAKSKFLGSLLRSIDDLRARGSRKP